MNFSKEKAQMNSSMGNQLASFPLLIKFARCVRWLIRFKCIQMTVLAANMKAEYGKNRYWCGSKQARRKIVYGHTAMTPEEYAEKIDKLGASYLPKFLLKLATSSMFKINFWFTTPLVTYCDSWDATKFRHDLPRLWLQPQQCWVLLVHLLHHCISPANKRKMFLSDHSAQCPSLQLTNTWDDGNGTPERLL